MVTQTTTIDSIIDDWLSKSGRTQESVPEELVLSIADDIVSQCSTDLQLQEKIALIPVVDYRAALPKDFKYVIQAAFKQIPVDPCIKERVTEWIQETLDGSGCKIRINVECPQCHQVDCSCSTPFVEVDANRIWENSNPQIYTNHMSHFTKFGHTHNRGSCYYYPDWRLIRKTSTTFYNVAYHINECVNFRADHDIEYNIEPPNVLLNVPRGTLLLSYFGVKTDEKGLRYVPDIPEMRQAIFFSIEETLALQEYIQNGGQREAVKYDRLKGDASLWRTRARNKLQIPPPDEWHQFLKNHWTKLIPYYGWWENYNRGIPDEFRYPDQTYNTKGYNSSTFSKGSSWTY